MLFKVWKFCVCLFRFNVFMPLAIQNAYTTGKPVTSHIIDFSPLHHISTTSTAELIQWGTLIIFDTLIGHTDRYNA